MSALVIPCWNEAARLELASVRKLVEHNVTVVLVDDGSTDATLSMLQALASAHPNVSAISSGTRQGRGEAVRLGLRHAIAAGHQVVGYTDADFAVAPTDILDLLALHQDSQASPTPVNATLGIRPLRLRSRPRRILGRAFRATLGGLVLPEIADPQCPMKWLSVTPELCGALAEPFELDWTFDVVLLARLFATGKFSHQQHTLRNWADRPGSKHTPRSMALSYVTTVIFALKRLGPGASKDR